MVRRLLLTLPFTGAILAAGTGTAAATSVFQSVTVKAPAACAPSPPRTARPSSSERETARGPTSYTYTIEKSPLLLMKAYTSTLQLLAQGDGQTKVEWSSSFTPDEGHEEEASEVGGGIYREGLENIVKLAGK